MKNFADDSLHAMSQFMLSRAQIDSIACQCHEANRQYCISLGDTSQPSWHDAPDWQKDSAKDGVLFMVRGNFPTPEESHQNWMNHKTADGWVYGEEKDPIAKTHYCMVPYAELPAEQRKKDEIFRNTVISAMKRIIREHNEAEAPE
jgi:hypothetical protein